MGADTLHQDAVEKAHQAITEVAVLTNVVANLKDQVVTLTSTVTLLAEKVQTMNTTISEARGGWRVLMYFGGAGGLIGAAIAQLLSHLKWS